MAPLSLSCLNQNKSCPWFLPPSFSFWFFCHGFPTMDFYPTIGMSFSVYFLCLCCIEHLWICGLTVFIKFGKNSAINFSNIFCLISLSFSWGLRPHVNQFTWSCVTIYWCFVYLQVFLISFCVDYIAISSLIVSSLASDLVNLFSVLSMSEKKTD